MIICVVSKISVNVDKESLPRLILDLLDSIGPVTFSKFSEIH